jgi:hypothetical protein
MEEYTKLTGKEINKLKPGDWVAWRKERWKPIGRDTEWAEARLTEPSYPLLSSGFCAIWRHSNTNREESVA